MRTLAVCVALILSSTAGSAASRFVKHQPGSDTLIVFVHGVTGDGTSTWTNERTRAYWPSLVANDPVFATANVFAYEYPSPIAGRSLNINELAEDLRLTLGEVLLANQRLVFVAHSMGGLIVRQYLIKYREVGDRVALIYFYATPTTGSPMALLATLFSKNPQLGNLRPMKVDEYLGNLQRDWLAAAVLRTIPSFCAYETRPTFSMQIVDQESATNLCNQPLDPIDANHIDIVKPESVNDKRYRTFKSAYTATIGEGRSPGLRAEIQNATQTIGLKGAAPSTTLNEPVFCDTFRLNLVLAHDGRSKTPVLINSIALNVSPVDVSQLAKGAVCQVDRLSSQPHGIVEKNVFLVTLTDTGVNGRFLKNASDAVRVDSRNILVAPGASRAISLKPDEEPTSLDVLVQSLSRQARALSFTITYDYNGEKTITTKRLVVLR